jgi:hypothetical protein
MRLPVDARVAAPVNGGGGAIGETGVLLGFTGYTLLGWSVGYTLVVGAAGTVTVSVEVQVEDVVLVLGSSSSPLGYGGAG